MTSQKRNRLEKKNDPTFTVFKCLVGSRKTELKQKVVTLPWGAQTANVFALGFCPALFGFKLHQFIFCCVF